MKFCSKCNIKIIVIIGIILILFLGVLFCSQSFRFKLYDKGVLQPFTADEQYDYACKIREFGKWKIEQFNQFIKFAERDGKSDIKESLIVDRAKAEQHFNKRAFYWLLKSAENGNEQAQCDVGWYYYEGKFVNKDDDEAFKWFLKSAKLAEEKNEMDSFKSYVFYLVGQSYYYGQGTYLDLEEAKIWLEKSADLGGEPSLEILKAIDMKIANNKLLCMANGIKNPKGRNLRITGSVVNFRKDPKGESLGYFDKDEIVTILSDDGDYYHVRRSDGSTGYVFAYYCKIE